MTTKNHKYVTEFNGNYLSVINQDDDFYLTSKQIGEALGYSDPRLSVQKIYERNKVLFDEYTCVVKMTTQVQKRSVRIFNEEGVMLICMKSKQPQAIEFQKWAVKTLKDYRHGNLELELKPNEWIAFNRLYLQLCTRATAAKSNFERDMIIERIKSVADKIDAQMPDFALLEKPMLDALSVFWRFYDEHSNKLNHSKSEQIAINFPHLKDFADQQGYSLDIDFLKRHIHKSDQYQFIATKNMRSRLLFNKVVHCWVFNNKNVDPLLSLEG